MVHLCFTMQTNVDKDQVKAAIKAQQDQQINNASILNFNSVNNRFHNLMLIIFLFLTGTFS